MTTIESDSRDRTDRVIARFETRIQGIVPALAAKAGALGLLALRISMGLVIAGFGFLKFFPGASPAEALAMRTTEVLTFGLVDGRAAVVLTASIEVTLGLVLLAGRFLKPGLVLMAGWLVGILSPLVLFPDEMFPGGLPTLAAQYVLKDVILAAVWLVLVAQALGARLKLDTR
jgi:putative oxidoreductase